MLGGSMGQAVTLYPTGSVNHLPSPPGQKLFDADRVDTFNPLLSLSAKNNQERLEHKTFTKNPDFSHSVRK